jgi:hypothetical protein
VKEFHSQIRQRAEEAQRSLAEARESGDDYLMEIRLGEMESLARIAAEHEVVLDGISESLVAHGRRPPAPSSHPGG